MWLWPVIIGCVVIFIIILVSFTSKRSKQSTFKSYEYHMIERQRNDISSLRKLIHIACAREMSKILNKNSILELDEEYNILYKQISSSKKKNSSPKTNTIVFDHNKSGNILAI